MSETTFIVNGEDIFAKIERLQAENELLKDANAHLKTELKQRYDEPDFESFRLMGKTIDEWKQLEAENERLKALCNTLFTFYRAKHNDVEGNLFSYRKALEEIREIATNAFNLEDDDGGYLYQKILDKINEVLK